MAVKYKDIQNISVIGAGLMGHGIAQVFAAQGYPVTLMDVRDELLSEAKVIRESK